jgi:hypothetical protein
MRARSTLALLLALGLGSLVLSKPPAPTAVDADAKRVAELIQNLGSDRFQERSAAQKELEAIGTPALAHLKKALSASDLEVSKRAAELVRKIEEKALTAALLAPKRVQLKTEDLPALEAVHELARLSGYTIHVAGDRTKVADKRVTLHTGEIDFWQAFDLVCAQAGLMEQHPVPSSNRKNDWEVQAARQAVIQLQIQGQPWQVQNVGGPMASPAAITLAVGTLKSPQFSHAGSVRSRIHARPRSKNDYHLVLDVSAEPRLQGFTIVGQPSITKAIDDKGQELALLDQPNEETPAPRDRKVRRVVLVEEMMIAAPVPQRQLAMRFKAGAQPAKSFRELSGNFTAQIIAPPEPLIIMDNVVKAAGTSVAGKSGGTLKLQSVEKLAGGDYKLQMYIEAPPLPHAGGMNGVIQMQQQIRVGGFGAGLGNVQGLPELWDAKGNKFQAIHMPSRRMNINNGAVSQEVTVVYRGRKDQGEPDRLVLHGSRAVNVTVPFAFQNVPLE